MDPKLFLFCVLLGLVHKSHTACLCGFGEGRDMCSSSELGHVGGGPMVVRPAPYPKIPFITGPGCTSKSRIVGKEVIDVPHPSGFKPLRPIGDLCSCRQTIVVPANVPRPACRKCGGNPTIYEPVPVVEVPEPDIYPIPTGTGSGIPVDPVSLGIVCAQSRRDFGRFSDDRLSYGPSKLPLDQPIIKASKYKLPEKNLYQIKGVPIELIPIRCQRQQQSTSIDDEAIEDLLQEEDFREEQEQETRTIPQFTYDDLGFRDVTYGQPKFIAVHGTAPEDDTSEDLVFDDIGDFTGGPFTCKDGYKPGNVIIKSIPQRDVYVPAPRIPITCADEDSDEHDVFCPVSPRPYPVYPGTGGGVIYEPYPCDS